MSSASRPTVSTSSAVRQVPHGEGETHPVMGDPMRFIMTAAHTGGTYAISEIDVRPGSGAPPHIHHNEEEAFYVLEGTFTATVDGTTHRMAKGDYLHVPRGRVRDYLNTGETHGRLLILHCPGSAADFYIGMGKLEVPPRIEDIKALGDRFGIEVVGPGAGAE